MRFSLYILATRAASLTLAFCFTVTGAYAGKPEPVAGVALLRAMDLDHAGFQELSLVTGKSAGSSRSALRTRVSLDGQSEELVLRPQSIRSKHFRVRVVGSKGRLTDYAPPPTYTMRGELAGRPESRVAAEMRNGRLTAVIAPGDGSLWCVQPIPSSLVSPSSKASQNPLYLVYEADDLAPMETTCASEFIPPTTEAKLMSKAAKAGAGLSIAEIAFDADYEFFLAKGASVEDVVADIESVLNGVNVIYKRDVGIEHQVSTIIVRTTQDDPYTSSDAHTLLDEFQSTWNADQASVTRDVAHLMTGRDLTGSTIGIASVGVVCSPYSGYGLSQSTFSANFTRRVALTAHELGHNWGAPHCSCNIMCPSIGACGGDVTSFSPSSVDSIASFRESRNCLDTASSEEPELSLTVSTNPTTPKVSEETEIVVVVSNDGPGPAADVWLSVGFGGPVVLVRSQPLASQEGETYRLALDTIASGSSAVAVLTVRPANPGMLEVSFDVDTVSNEINPFNNHAGLELSVAMPQATPATDFDGDLRSDVSIYEPSSGNWFILESGADGFRYQNWGYAGTTPVAADYDGDGEVDIAVFEPASGTWYILESGTGSLRIIHWGWSATVPVPGDYDGDGRADVAVFYPEGGDWYILQSSTDTLLKRNWGWSATTPVPGDYDNDGVCDIAVFHKDSGNWYIHESKTDSIRTANWGWSDTEPAPGDYDGDGACDLTVFHAQQGDWYIRESSTGELRLQNWGWNEVVPVPTDYNGDGQCDIAVFHPDSGNWYVQESGTGQLRLQNWGYSATAPVLSQEWIKLKDMVAGR